MITLDDIQFFGWRGTLQRPKPVFDSYTRLGANQVYMQQLRVESLESNIEASVILNSLEEARAHERALRVILGLPKSFTYHDAAPILGVYLKDYQHKIRAGANGKYLIEYSLVLICDEISSEEG